MPSQAEGLLAETDPHIAEAEARVAQHRELIAKQSEAGEDATLSREVLRGAARP
jgi:hypothetical protein